MEAIQWLQKFTPWASDLSFAPKLVLSVIIVAIPALLLMLIWTKPPPPPLRGTVTARIWNPNDNTRRGLSLKDDEALPLRHGDQIRVEAIANRPSYLYIVWIEADGQAKPVYPWQLGNWEALPEVERPVKSISLPEGIDTAWPMGGPAGMETLVLLGREDPLPKQFDLRAAFSGLPEQMSQDRRSLVWLDSGEVPEDVERGPQFFEIQKVDDPILVTQRLIAERLQPHFSLIHAVSFANQGE